MNNIHPTAIIYEGVTLGDNVTIGPYCLIGSPPEHRNTYPDKGKGVIIGDNVKITGHVTIDSGIEFETRIYNDVFIMKFSHIGHDAVIGEGVTISPHVCVGGHAKLGEKVNMGMGSIVHQRCNVAQGCMVGMGAVITKRTDTKPYCVYVGSPARYLRENKWHNV